MRTGFQLRANLKGVALAVLCQAWTITAFCDVPTYNVDIRPILVEHCFSCHGADSASRKAGLRLDQFAAATVPVSEGGTAAIVPGQSAVSEMIARITSTDPDLVMPPPAAKKPLSAEQIVRLKTWIDGGAKYEQHWSFIPPQKPTVPAIADPAFTLQNPIDHFILDKLNQAGLKPAGEAGRRTLARRLSFDLTGLPPAPERVEAFVADPAPDAYERLVDELLASPAWGEHRGRYWLDAARYGDTHGIHIDNFREIWTYRDWVIKAFNSNMPFDQFTIEQLAGDLLPNRSLDQQIASGFNRCNITTSEGGAIDEEYLVLYNRDRTETTALIWMGLTAGCAVCHDHKFDPLSQKEFYEMAAFFNNSTQKAMDGNVKNTPPIVTVPRSEDMERWFALDAEIAHAKEAVEARRKNARDEFNSWQATAGSEVIASRLPTTGILAQSAMNEGEGKSLAIQIGETSQTIPLTEATSWQEGPAGTKALLLKGNAAQLPDLGDFERDKPWSIAAWVKLSGNDIGGALCARMDEGNSHVGWDLWVQSRRVGMHIIHSWPDNALKVVAKDPVPDNQWTHVVITYDGSSRAAGLKIYYDGKLQAVNVEQNKLKGSIKTRVPFKIGSRENSAAINPAGLTELKLYDRVLTDTEAASLGQATALLAGLRKAPADRTEAEQNQLYDWWLGALDSPYQAAVAKHSALEGEHKAIKDRGSIAHVMQEKTEPAMAFILNRGEYDQRKDQVFPATPAVLPTYPEELPRNRLGFAKWILMPDQPLTTRVTVNRAWQEVFGRGIVSTPGDFGITGQLPSHPELLDWLAIDFRESGWDVKRLYKQMVMSSTYRQEAVTTSDKLEKDRENVLLSRGPRFRMDAEMIRDTALAVSGLLSGKIGGPSVRPYQPDGVWEAVAMIGSDTRNYKRDTGESLYRRSLYTFWKRSAPPAQMEIFNAPSRETCTVRRERTNTPLQALVTLNDEQFVEAARVLAEKVLKSGTDFDSRLDQVTARALSRPLSPEERSVVQQMHGRLQEYYKANEENAKQLIAVGESKANAELPVVELAAWTMTINELMNLDEVLNK